MNERVERIDQIAEVSERLDRVRRDGRTIGFVPTMGYLHAGHASLVAAARADCDEVVVSVFVNPLQFAPEEDLAAYPRDLERDVGVIESAGGTVVFCPTVEEMYPEPMATTVQVAGVTERFEGASRPTHFAGVATVVAKLFGIIGPCRAYFGEKDFQQLALVRRLVRDLCYPVDVVGVETVREPDGLAKSSRNVYLSDDERRAAPVLYAGLCAGRDVIVEGERDPEMVLRSMRRVFSAEPRFHPDYVAVVDAATLEPLERVAGNVRLLAAGRLGRPRLLDNVGVTVR